MKLKTENTKDTIIDTNQLLKAIFKAVTTNWQKYAHQKYTDYVVRNKYFVT